MTSDEYQTSHGAGKFFNFSSTGSPALCLVQFVFVSALKALWYNKSSPIAAQSIRLNRCWSLHLHNRCTCHLKSFAQEMEWQKASVLVTSSLLSAPFLPLAELPLHLPTCNTHQPHDTNNIHQVVNMVFWASALCTLSILFFKDVEWSTLCGAAFLIASRNHTSKEFKM
jgi:hypothetical protein